MLNVVRFSPQATSSSVVQATAHINVIFHIFLWLDIGCHGNKHYAAGERPPRPQKQRANDAKGHSRTTAVAQCLLGNYGPRSPLEAHDPRQTVVRIAEGNSLHRKLPSEWAKIWGRGLRPCGRGPLLTSCKAVTARGPYNRPHGEPLKNRPLTASQHPLHSFTAIIQVYLR